MRRSFSPSPSRPCFLLVASTRHFFIHGAHELYLLAHNPRQLKVADNVRSFAICIKKSDHGFAHGSSASGALGRSNHCSSTVGGRRYSEVFRKVGKGDASESAGSIE